MVGASTVTPIMPFGTISDHSVSAAPATRTLLDTVEMRVRRMFHHWK
jgi:hypothetical protein